jgi:hypothetical protein
VEQETSWTPLFRSGAADGKPPYTLISNVSFGGRFPVKLHDEKLPTHGEELFTVEMVDGDDDKLQVVATRPGGEEEAVELVRDKSVDVKVDGETYNLSYTTRTVARDEPAQTNTVTIIVSWRPKREALGDDKQE